MPKVFKWVRVGALVAPAVSEVLRYPGDPNVVNTIMESYTGYNMVNGTWNIEALKRGWLPYLGACLATYGIPKISSILRRL
jgi:hypothetical protein